MSDLLSPLRAGDIYGVGKLVPSGGVGVSGHTIMVDPAAGKYRPSDSLNPTGWIDIMRKVCYETLLICLPHGYGFFPILPAPEIRNCVLAFGKLGCDRYVIVTVECRIDLHAQTFDLLYHIKDGKTYSKSEIRLFALDVVNTINDLNGIDASEQDDKGSD